jgi:hypothetical protein
MALLWLPLAESGWPILSPGLQEGVAVAGPSFLLHLHLDLLLSH